MIECPVRQDIKEYKPRPIMGLSWRELIFIILSATVCLVLFTLFLSLNLPGSIASALLLLISFAIAFFGFGERYLHIAPEVYMRRYVMELIRPKHYLHSFLYEIEPEVRKKKLTRQQKKALRKEKKLREDEHNEILIVTKIGV